MIAFLASAITNPSARMPSARTTFFDHCRTHEEQRPERLTHTNRSPTNPGHFSEPCGHMRRKNGHCKGHGDSSHDYPHTSCATGAELREAANLPRISRNEGSSDALKRHTRRHGLKARWASSLISSLVPAALFTTIAAWPRD